MFHEFCQKKIVSIRFQKKEEEALPGFDEKTCNFLNKYFLHFWPYFPLPSMAPKLQITDYTLNPKLLSVAFLKRKKFSSTCIVLCWSLKIAFKCIYLNQLFWHHFFDTCPTFRVCVKSELLKIFPWKRDCRQEFEHI